MEESDTAGAVTSGGINYEVTGKRHYTFRSPGGGVLAEYLLFDIADAETVYVLAAVLTGEHVELRVYYRPDGFQPGTRATLIDHGFAWLFLAPSQPRLLHPLRAGVRPPPRRAAGPRRRC